MFQLIQRSPWLYGTGLGVAAALLVLGFSQASGLFATDGFTPHGYCLLWRPGLIWFSVVSDFLIGAAYVAISATLVYLVYLARRDIPFQWIFLAFGTFIVACGTTHFIEVWTVWEPVYYLAAGTKLITALASVTTALILPPLIPKTLQLIDAAKHSQQRKEALEQANNELREARILLQQELVSQSQSLATLAGEVAQRTKQLEQAVRTRDEFLSLAAHELKTPLTTLLGNAQLVERRSGQAGSASIRDQRALRVVVEQAMRLNKMIGTLLDITRLEARQLSIAQAHVDVAALAKRTVEEVQPTLEQHVMRYTGPSENLPVIGDELRLEQVLQNLLQNAIKYSPDGGTIDLRVAREGTWVALSVRDQGVGIAQDALPLIFERFYRAPNTEGSQVSGLGIGLYVVREIVLLHGGDISVVSAEGQGSTFTVRLPLASNDHANKG